MSVEFSFEPYVPQPVPQAFIQPRPLTVLLVDDDSLAHEVFEAFLSDTEYTLMSANSVGQALRLVASTPPDIIITDAMMPGESGFVLIEKLKSNPHSSHIPVVLWTVLEDMRGNVMDASGKADMTLNKPFYPADINKCLLQARSMVQSRVMSAA
jgi:CheY-like chemotaxis protein